MANTKVIQVKGVDPYDIVIGRALLGEVGVALGSSVKKVLVIHPVGLTASAELLKSTLDEQGYEAILAGVPDSEDAKRVEVAAFCWGVLGQADFTGLEQRVPLLHHNGVMPLPARQSHNAGYILQGFGGNRQIDVPAHEPFGKLVGHALVQHHLHPRVALAQLGNGLGQEVAGLGVRRRDDQVPDHLVAELLADAADVLGLEQRALREAVDVPPGARKAR